MFKKYYLDIFALMIVSVCLFFYLHWNFVDGYVISINLFVILVLFFVFYRKLFADSAKNRTIMTIWQFLCYAVAIFIANIAVTFIGMSRTDYSCATQGLPGGFFEMSVVMVSVIVAVVVGIASIIVGDIVFYTFTFLAKRIHLLKKFVNKDLNSWIISIMLLICILPIFLYVLSFKSLGGIYYKVGGEVYVLKCGSGLFNSESVKIDDADVKTFEVLDGSLAKDKNNCYIIDKVAKKKEEKELCE